MAEIEFDRGVAGDDPAQAANVSSIINGLGAVVSLALIAGLGWWGYNLLMRDVTGVPVVRALEGPMRVAPENPGGSSAEYQGLAVNNIPAVGEAETPADRLVLAPKPTLLTPEDQTAKSLAELAGTNAPAATPVARPQVADGGAERPEAAPGEQGAAAVVGQEVAQANVIEATLKALTLGEAPAEDSAAAVVEPTAVIPADVPGVAKSLVPVVRPDVSVETATGPEPASASASAPVSDGVYSIDPADIPVGTRLVQLGAFDSIDAAKAEWLRITARFEDFMAGKARVIEKAQTGGKVFYRLRAHGFDDLADARRFCSALLAGQTNCIPLTTR